MEDKVFDNDVLYMKSLVGKTVSICTVDDQVHEGIVYVIDPIYKTVVLTSQQPEAGLELVLHHAIKSLEVLSAATKSEFLQVGGPTLNKDDIEQRKLQLAKWLKHMFIHVEEKDDCLQVESHLRIEAPYGRCDCFCDNTIVLERIQKVIDLMPENFE